MTDREWEELRNDLLDQLKRHRIKHVRRNADDLVQQVLLELAEELAAGKAIETEPIYWSRQRLHSRIIDLYRRRDTERGALADLKHLKIPLDARTAGDHQLAKYQRYNRKRRRRPEKTKDVTEAVMA